MADYVVAVCSCPVGVAHTYMAADKFTEVAKKHGFKVKVETQGMTGIEDKLTDNDLKKAKWIVLANDVALRDPERFDAYKDKIIETSMHVMLHETKDFVENNLK